MCLVAFILAIPQSELRGEADMARRPKGVLLTGGRRECHGQFLLPAREAPSVCVEIQTSLFGSLRRPTFRQLMLSEAFKLLAP